MGGTLWLLVKAQHAHVQAWEVVFFAAGETDYATDGLKESYFGSQINLAKQEFLCSIILLQLHTYSKYRHLSSVQGLTLLDEFSLYS